MILFHSETEQYHCTQTLLYAAFDFHTEQNTARYRCDFRKQAGVLQPKEAVTFYICNKHLFGNNESTFLQQTFIIPVIWHSFLPL